MKYAIGPRREVGIRTIFNILGPLTNPAKADCQVMGVYRDDLVEPLARVLLNLGCRRGFVVHGSDGMDEMTLTGPTLVAEISEGELKVYTIEPEQFGLARCSLEDLKGAMRLKTLLSSGLFSLVSRGRSVMSWCSTAPMDWLLPDQLPI